MMEKRIDEYKIIYAQNTNVDEFNNEIRNAILEGWEIYGNHQLAVIWDNHNNTDCITITQAVVKYKD